LKLPYSWKGFLLYFLRLGSFGLGGPIALAGYMQRDLVDARRRLAGKGRIKSFVDGVTAGAVGAIAGAVIVLARRSIVDVPTAAMAAISLAVLLRFKKVPEPALILVAGIIGIALAHANYSHVD
jgi:chromate transport protein ChrA